MLELKDDLSIMLSLWRWSRPDFLRIYWFKIFFSQSELFVTTETREDPFLFLSVWKPPKPGGFSS